MTNRLSSSEPEPAEAPITVSQCFDIYINTSYPDGLDDASRIVLKRCFFAAFNIGYLAMDALHTQHPPFKAAIIAQLINNELAAFQQAVAKGDA